MAIPYGRRKFITDLSTVLVLGNALGSFGCEIMKTEHALTVDQQRQRVRDTNLDYALHQKGSVYWNLHTLVDNLTRGILSPQDRQQLFSFVQSFPYEIVKYDSTPVGLLDTERGDCRHKREFLSALFDTYGYEVRKTGVVFDWADLPIPGEILAHLKTGGTKGVHSSLEIRINGAWVALEPSWDPGLSAAGFPVVRDWDGAFPMLSVTGKSVTSYTHPYDRDVIEQQHGIRYVRAETDQFVEALNLHLRAVRVISHPFDAPLDAELATLRTPSSPSGSK